MRHRKRNVNKGCRPMNEYDSPDEVRKAVNDSLFGHLTDMVEKYNLRLNQVLLQDTFQEMWQSLQAFPQFDISYFSRKLHIEESWVNGWAKAEKRGNEVEGYIETDKLPKSNITVYLLLAAITFLDEKLKPRTGHRSVFDEVAMRKRKAQQEIAKEASEFAEKTSAPTMPDGRPWSTELSSDPLYNEMVSFRGRKALAKGAVDLAGEPRPNRFGPIITFHHLVSRTEAELLSMPDFGRKSLNQVRSFLTKQTDLCLGMDVE